MTQKPALFLPIAMSALPSRLPNTERPSVSGRTAFWISKTADRILKYQLTE